ncbi:MAG TPA: gliding motility-associated C-terminal domain-containing protein, partial [Chitinophagaceae bacterium]
FANQAENGQEFLRVTEVKGNNIETSDCTGRDTSFVKSQPHILAPITFAWDTIRTETATTINTNYTLIDFSFNREEICSSISICDSLRITGPGSICLNSPQQLFTAKRNPGCLKVPNWKIDPAAIQSMQTINDSTVTIIFKQAWEGYLYAFNSSCDRLSDSIYIRVLANPVVSIQLGNDTTFCSPVILDAGAGFESYRWQDGSTNRSFTVRHEGIYYVTATDRCNNIFTDTIHFSAKQTELFIGNDSCVQFPYVLTANNGFASYQWQDGSSQPQFMAAMPGIYVVKTTNACNEAFTDTIVLNKKLLAFSLGNDTTICAGRPIHLSAPAGFTAYQWQDNSANNNFTAAAPGTYYVAVNDACGNLISDTITIQPLQLAFTAGNDTLICKKERIVLQASSGFVNYSWQPDYRISNANTMMVWVEPEITTAYRVMAQTNSGCTVTDTILIEVKDCPQYLYIPSAFTPNRDGKNDLFKPSVSGVLEEYEFIVYNRWGQTVFRSTDHRKGWDGTLKGTALDNAVFIWICRYKFPGLPAELKKGTVMLIR